MGSAQKWRSPGEKGFKQIHPDTGIFPIGMQLTGHLFVRIHPPQRFRLGHLQHQHLILPQRLFGDPVAGLDNIGFLGVGGGFHSGGMADQPLDADCIDAVVVALINDLQGILRPDDGHRQLNPPSAPAPADGKLPGAEGHLITGNADGMQDGSADLPFGPLVQKSEVIILPVIFPHHDPCSFFDFSGRPAWTGR